MLKKKLRINFFFRKKNGIKKNHKKRKKKGAREDGMMHILNKNTVEGISPWSKSYLSQIKRPPKAFFLCQNHI